MASRAPLLCLAALGEDLQELVAGDAFAAIDLGHAFFEPLVEGGLADLKPFLLGLKEIESLGDDLGGGAIMAAVEFALDALFGCGIEGDRHGGKYSAMECRIAVAMSGGDR